MADGEREHPTEDDPKLSCRPTASSGGVVPVLAPMLDVSEEAVEERDGGFADSNLTDGGEDDLIDVGLIGRQRLRRERSFGLDLAVVLAVLQPQCAEVLEGGVAGDARYRRIDAFVKASFEHADGGALGRGAGADGADPTVDVADLDARGPSPV